MSQIGEEWRQRIKINHRDERMRRADSGFEQDLVTVVARIVTAVETGGILAQAHKNGKSPD